MNKKRWLTAVALVLLSVQCHFESRNQGEQLYSIYCQNCHGSEGEGLRQLIPPLAGADFLQQHQENLPCIIMYGMDGEILVNEKRYNQPMPPNPDLEPIEVANIINYINSAWGNDFGFVPLSEVERQLKNCRE
ncbi:MAG: cytochrome c [Bacteroidia bacterium]